MRKGGKETRFQESGGPTPNESIMVQSKHKRGRRSQMKGSIKAKQV